MASRFLTEADKNELAKRIPTKTSELSNDSGYVTDDAIPTRTSQLTNDSKYQNESQVKASIAEALEDIEVNVDADLSDYALKEDIPTKTSQLTNDSKYQNESQVKASIAEALKDVKVDVDLDDYALKEDIPTKTSQLENNSGFLTQHQDLGDIKESINRKANEIVATVTGEQFVLTDSANEKLRGMKLFGKSEQFTTGGNQLIPYPFTDTTKTVSGVTFTDEGDGWIRVSGTSTAKSAFLLVMDISLNVNSGEEVTVHSETVGSVDKLFITGWTSTWGKFLEDRALSLKAGASVTGKITSNIVKLQVSIEDVDTNFDGKIRVMINKGTTALPYEPYTGGILSPNPNYPQEIESSGDDGFVEVEFVGKNIADCSDAQSGYPNSTVGDTLLLNPSIASTTYRNCFNVVKDKQYVVTWKSNTPFSETMRVSVITDNSLNVVQTFNVYVKNESVSFIANQDGIVHLCMDNHSTDIQAEYGSSGTSYESYEKQSRVIPTPNGLCGILVTDATVATYIDSDGQMWCCDEIDLEEGTYIERLVCITLDGTENWGQTGTNEYRCSFDNIIPRDNFGGVLCTHYKPAPKNQRNINNTIIRGVNGYQIFICDERFGGDVEAFKAYIASEKVNGTPVKVLCQRVNFVKTKLSTEEIEYYKAIRMGYPNTTITSDAFVKVDYVADTKNYIDNKFAELATALVAMGGI